MKITYKYNTISANRHSSFSADDDFDIINVSRPTVVQFKQ